MKRLLLLLLPIAFIVTSYAQTTTGERLIAGAAYSLYGTGDRGELLLRDSVFYTWGGGRSSIQVGNPVTQVWATQFDDAESWGYSPSGIRRRGHTLQSFNSAGQLTRTIDQKWDTLHTVWINNGKTDYDYSGRDTVTVWSLWDEAKATWVYYRRSNIIASPGSIEYREDYWNSTTAVWDMTTRTVYNYSGKDITEVIDQERSLVPGVWMNRSRLANTYSGGHLTEGLKQLWDTSVKDWQNSSRTTDVYSGDNITSHIEQDWDKSTGLWENTNGYNATYSGKLLQEYISLSWNASTHAWQKFERSVFNYSGANLLHSVTQEWNFIINDWDYYKKRDYTYDGDNIKTLAAYAWDIDINDWRLLLLEDYSFNAANNLVLIKSNDGEVQYQEDRFYYEKYTTNISETYQQIQQARIYPNPATVPQVYVDYNTTNADETTITLSDLSGKILSRYTEAGSIGDHSVMIPVSALAEGVYLVQLYSGDQLVKTMKLVK